jgi:hypothetical protein
MMQGLGKGALQKVDRLKDANKFSCMTSGHALLPKFGLDAKLLPTYGSRECTLPLPQVCLRSRMDIIKGRPQMPV